MDLENNPVELNNANSVPQGVTGGIFVYSVTDNYICFADENVIELFGCKDIDELRELTDNSFIGMVYPDDREEIENTIKEYNSDIRKPHNYIRYRIITKQGTYRYVEDFGHRLQSSDGKMYCYVFIAGIEKTEYEKSKHIIFDEEKLLNADINADRLTGHLNMDAFFIKSKELQQKQDEEGAKPANVIVFDILGLMEINRTLGHAEGDARIYDLAMAVQDNMPDDSVIFRGHEADIIAVCEDKSEHDLMPCIKEVVRVCKSPILFGIGSGEVIANSKEEESLMRALEEAQLDLRIKKLLNEKSHQSQTLSTLIRALEEVDSDTEAHVQRTQTTGIALGRRVGLSDLQISLLQMLCLLHDIGKIAVPLEILNKPGKLTDEEWAVLRTHPEKGYQIATATDELKPLADMILYHHERWDGRGYPAGLAGEEIPVLSRIISIVDAYDAMVNDRSYRKGMFPENAMKEIRENAGTQFDPVLAEEFLALLDENPSLALGSQTGGEEVRVFDRTFAPIVGSGMTKPVAFSKYKLNLDDVIIEADDSFIEITGYSREDAVGKMTQYDLIPEKERDYYIDQVRRQFAVGDIAYLQHPLKRKDGSVIQVICNGERYFDSSVRAFRSDILIFKVTE